MFNALRKTFNISGCDIVIQPNQSAYHQGDSVSCELIITGGKYDQNASEITVELEESYTTGSGESQTTHYKTIDKKLLESNISLKPGEAHKYGFSTTLPPNCRLSSSSDHVGWALVVKVDVPSALDPEERILLQVNPHREFFAVWQACEFELRFTQKSSFSPNYYSDRFMPPQALKNELDCMDLSLFQNGATTDCTITFDLQEKSVADYFKMVTFQDKVQKEISFSSEEIFDDEGNAKTAVIAQKIAKEMQQVIEANQ